MDRWVHIDCAALRGAHVAYTDENQRKLTNRWEQCYSIVPNCEPELPQLHPLVIFYLALCMALCDNHLSSDANHAVKYVYCVLDEISGSLDRLGDTPDAALLSLLSQVESTFTYRHYHITQALNSTLLKSFTSWCLCRLLLIASRPSFVYHLTAVGTVVKKLLLLLERHHLDVFVSQSCLLFKVLHDVLYAMEKYDDSDDVETFDLQLKQFSHALSTVPVSWHAYTPNLIPSALHSFQLAIDLSDLLGKQRAFDALFRCTISLFGNPTSSPIRFVSLNYLLNGVTLVLNFLASWNTGSFVLSNSDGSFEHVTELEQRVAQSLNWLCNVATFLETLLQYGQVVDSVQFVLQSRTDLLSMSNQILSSSWSLQMEHGALNYALRNLLSVVVRADATASAVLKAESNESSQLISDQMEELPEIAFLSKVSTGMLYNEELSELKLESCLNNCSSNSVLCSWIQQLQASYSTSDSIDAVTILWLRSSRLWGAVRLKLTDLEDMQDDLVECCLSAIKHAVLSIPSVKQLESLSQTAPHHPSKWFSAYACLRLITNCSQILAGKGLVEAESLPSQKILCGPIIKLLCSLLTWTTPPLDVAENLTLLVNRDMQKDEHTLFWLSPLLSGLGDQSKGTVQCTAVAQGLLHSLARLTKQSIMTRPAALLLAHLSSAVICIQLNCRSSTFLYCAGHTATFTLPEETEEPDKLYTLDEQLDLISLFLESSNLEGTSEAVVDLAVHLASHVSWDLMSMNSMQSYFSLLQSNLPHFTPTIIGKIYSIFGTRLSESDLNKWIILHTSLVQLLSTAPRQGPSSSISSTAIDEYRIMQYGALATCLAGHYTDLLATQPNQSTTTTIPVERRNSNEGLLVGSSNVTSSCLMDALVIVIVGVCRLGLVHRYTHAVYGAVFLQVEALIKAIGIPPVHVVRICREKLAQVVADQMEQVVTPVIECLSRLFQLDKTAVFKELLSPLFIALVIRGNQDSHLQIRQVVSEVPYLRPGQDYVNKIVQLCVLPETLVYIFTRTSKDEQDVHFAVLESHLSMSIERIARLNDVSRLMHQFVLRLYPYRVGASHGLRWVASRVLLTRDNPSRLSNATAPGRGPASADFLGNYVCGILAFFDSTLLDDDAILEQRWIALRSLVVFIHLLGCGHVTRMRAKFMATLKICLRYKTPPFARVVIKAWRSFIQILEPNALCELLPDIGATLVGLIPYGPNQVTDLFDYIFLKKRDEISDRLSCLYFLPRTPKLYTGQQILDDLCAWRCLSMLHQTKINESELQSLLSTWLAALTHSSRSVRRLALTSELTTSGEYEMPQTVASKRLWGLANVVIDAKLARKVGPQYGLPDSETSAYAVTRIDVCEEPQRSSSTLLGDLISSLLEGVIRDTDDRMRLLYAQWLGNLGPIDPSKVCLMTTKTSNTTGNSPSSPQTGKTNVNEGLFSLHILCELAKIYLRAASPRQLDSTALAIQELLKLFKVPAALKQQTLAPSSSSSNLQQDDADTTTANPLPYVAGSELWNLVPEHLRDLFAPLVTSRYAVEAFTDWTNVRSPLISTSPDLTFESWIRLWCGSLCSHITAPYAFSVFQFCEPVVKTDAGFARSLLEHAALQLILDDSSVGKEQLLIEILSVLEEVADAQDPDGVHHASSDELLMATSIPELNSPKTSRTKGHSRWKDWYPLAVQSVFGLLDHLRHWHREQQELSKINKANASKQAQPNPQPVVKAPHVGHMTVAEFLAKIPNTLQAKASLRCGGLARALIHWEFAYAEDKSAQQAAFNTGCALTVKECGLREASTTQKPTQSAACPLGIEGMTALEGLLDSYALLRDTDGLAGVLAQSHILANATRTRNTNSNRLEKSTANPENDRAPECFSALRALQLENEGQLEMAAAAYEHNLAWSEMKATQALSNEILLPSEGATVEQDQRLALYGGLFRCELSDPARLHGLMERAGALIRRPRDCPSSETSVMCSAVWTRRLNACRAEAAWRLSDWGTLRETTRTNVGPNSWSTDLGKLFLSISEQGAIGWRGILSQLRIGQMNDLCAAALEGPGGYARAYETIARLGALSDVELVAQLGESIRAVLSPSSQGHVMRETRCDLSIVDFKSEVENALTILDTRFRMSQPTFHTQEPCLAMQHTALHLFWLELQSRSKAATKADPSIINLVDRVRLAIGQNWLYRARLTRKYGQFMAAYTCVLRAEAFGSPHALLERAKLLWHTEKREAALSCLDDGIPALLATSNDKTNVNGDPISSLQQAMLLRARYSEETSRFDFEATRAMYEKVCNLREGYEEAHFRLARYVERACTLATVTGQHDSLLKAALTHYGLALSYGSQYIYQSMPRLLTLWLDYGSEFARRSQATNTRAMSKASNQTDARANPDKKTFDDVQKIMKQNCERIPAYQYYTALGQLLSRVCHELPTIVNALINLIVQIFVAYPLQTIWYLMPLNKDSIVLCEHLRTICSLYMTANRRDLRSFSLQTTLGALVRLVKNEDFSRILIPIHRQLVPNLLPAHSRHEDVKRHWPFGSGSGHLVCLRRIDDIVEILGSQTRPKKMTWLGTDGRRYIIVAKPNDDLRKDSRLMELNGMINKFLVKNADTRRRALQIRTYAVIPLSERGGLIEWVGNTEPFRAIITRLYNESGRLINWNAMSRVAPLLDDPLKVKREKYLEKWLPMFPLVFHNWFLAIFPNPSAWYSARQCYARTCAVMSMVGYVLGLGDRHTENILFDSTSGGVVHVDFSCVFNNGLTLPWPERVPFRLTRNMVRALGPTGYEGNFRRCAEAVMRLLRHEVDPLLAVFRPIYFDAVAEQGGNAPGGSELGVKVRRPGDVAGAASHDSIERAAQAARDKLNKMEDRLHGKITEHDGFSQILPMSAEGQVDALIKEATGVDQLCQMYKGWMPFL